MALRANDATTARAAAVGFRGGPTACQLGECSPTRLGNAICHRWRPISVPRSSRSSPPRSYLCRGTVVVPPHHPPFHDPRTPRLAHWVPGGASPGTSAPVTRCHHKRFQDPAECAYGRRAVIRKIRPFSLRAPDGDHREVPRLIALRAKDKKPRRQRLLGSGGACCLQGGECSHTQLRNAVTHRGQRRVAGEPGSSTTQSVAMPTGQSTGSAAPRPSRRHFAAAADLPPKSLGRNTGSLSGLPRSLPPGSL